MGDTTACNATNSSILSLWDLLENMSIYADFLLCKTCPLISPLRIILTFLKKWIGSSPSNYNHSHTGKKEETYSCSLKVDNLSLCCSIKRKKVGERTGMYDPWCWTANLNWSLMRCNSQQDLLERVIMQLAQRCCATPWDDSRRVKQLRRSLKFVITLLYTL